MGTAASVGFATVAEALAAGKSQKEIDAFLAAHTQQQQQQGAGDEETRLPDPWAAHAAASADELLALLAAGTHTERVLIVDADVLEDEGRTPAAAGGDNVDSDRIGRAIARFYEQQLQQRRRQGNSAGGTQQSWTGLSVNGVDGLTSFELTPAMADHLLFLDLTDNDNLERLSFGGVPAGATASDACDVDRSSSSGATTADHTAATATMGYVSVSPGSVSDSTNDIEAGGTAATPATANTTTRAAVGAMASAAADEKGPDGTQGAAAAMAAMVAVNVGAATRLRELNLSGLPAAALPSAGAWPRVGQLLSLDLSFVDGLDLGSAEGGSAQDGGGTGATGAVDWGALPFLLRLNLESCDLTTLAVGTFAARPPPALRWLNVADNQIASTDGLAPLRKLQHLHELDARGNPVASSGTSAQRDAYLAVVRAWVGATLKVVDNKILNVSMSSQALAEVEGLAERVNATDTVLDDAEGGERCSCLEGNACQDPYTCKDWNNRDQVAAQVRKDKNLQLHYICNT